MTLALWHWHIEISSKCTLRCPRCARQEVPDSLVNTELKLDFFKKNFTVDFIEKHVEKITFCGDDGDPIYAHDLIDTIKYFKSVKPISIVLVTNGAYKNDSFWRELSSILDSNDVCHFSIDGYDQHSNNKYRINTDYTSVISGAKIVNESKRCYTVWDCIAFKFNQDHIEKIKNIAKDTGFDMFQLTKSTKFGKVYSHYGSDDELEPDDSYISFNHRFTREHTCLSDRVFPEAYKKTNDKHYEDVKPINDIIPLCHVGNKGLFINSQGEFYPCCWVANRYSHNDTWSRLGKKYNLYDNNLNDVINIEFFNREFVNESYECKTKCNKNLVTKNYATEW